MRARLARDDEVLPRQGNRGGNGTARDAPLFRLIFGVVESKWRHRACAFPYAESLQAPKPRVANVAFHRAPREQLKLVRLLLTVFYLLTVVVS